MLVVRGRGVKSGKPRENLGWSYLPIYYFKSSHYNWQKYYKEICKLKLYKCVKYGFAL